MTLCLMWKLYLVSNCLLCNFHAFADFSQNYFFSKHSIRNTIRVANGLDPGQDRCSVSPDLILGLNCLQTKGYQQTTKVTERVNGLY